MEKVFILVQWKDDKKLLFKFVYNPPTSVQHSMEWLKTRKPLVETLVGAAHNYNAKMGFPEYYDKEIGEFVCVDDDEELINEGRYRVEIIEDKIPQIAADYARTLPAPDSDGFIQLENGRQYTPELDIFLRHGATHCSKFMIWRDTSDDFVGYPANFFNDLIKHYYETKTPGNAVHHVVIRLPLENPVPWPTALVQPQAGEMKVEVLKVRNASKSKRREYILRNKYNPSIAFTLRIFFQGGAKRYQEMTAFICHQSSEAQE